MTVTSEKSPQHLLRLGTHLEKQFFEQGSLYDAIIVNANVVEAFPTAIAGLLARFKKNFAIDPITYGFAMPPKNLMRVVVDDPKTKKKHKEPKKTFLRLAKRYVDIFHERLASGSSTLLADINFPEVRSALCENVLKFQKERLLLAVSEEDREYLAFAGSEIRPAILFAPYFYMESLDDGWLDLNLRLIEESLAISSNKDHVYGMICFDPELLEEPEHLKKLSELYSKLPCSGFFIWLNNFNEQRAAAKKIVGLVSLLKAFHPRPVYSAYGGYLSQLLACFGMTGTCHGPGYGEHRDVCPVGGGVPTAQYYVKPLRQRLVYADAEVIVPESLEEFYSRICECSVCKEVVADDINRFELFGEMLSTETDRGIFTYSSVESIRNCTRHYIQVKAMEIEEIRSAIATNSTSSLAQTLRSDATWLEPKLGEFGVAHLKRWAELLHPSKK